MKALLTALAMLALVGCGPTLDSTLDSAALPLSPSAILAPSGQAEARAAAAMVIDVRSGRILYADNENSLRYPASLTKMMTLYLLFEELKSGRLSHATLLTVSDNAAAQPPSRLGLKAGTTITVADALRALAVKSANDVATVIAENLAGTEAAFAARMTQTAASLGMSRTRFVNASGLPDERQVSTARDMAILGRTLKLRHPRLTRHFSAREFRYGGRTYRATNRLLGAVRGVDGIKTGYIRMSGYNLVASAKRGRRQIIVVLFGGRTGRERDAAVAALIDRHL